MTTDVIYVPNWKNLQLTQGIILLALKLTGANVHDSRMLEAVVDAVPPIRSCWGPPRKRPSNLHAG